MVISVISDINLPLSTILLFWTYAVCYGEVTYCKTSFNFFASALDNVFISAFNNEIGLQFLMYLLSLSFLSFNLIYSCLWEILNSFLSLTCFIEEIKITLILSLKFLFKQISFSIVLIESYKSFSVNSMSQRIIWSVESFGMSRIFRKWLISSALSFWEEFWRRVSS